MSAAKIALLVLLSVQFLATSINTEHEPGDVIGGLLILAAMAWLVVIA